MPESSGNEFLKKVKEFHSDRGKEIRDRLGDFSRVKRENYFYELVYCLLTPQSKALNADKAVQLLRDRDFREREFNPESLLRRRECYIRFHKKKSSNLTAVKKQYPLIEKILSGGMTSAELRVWLVKNVKGLGWKEASHFLRNIGHRNLAILDRHVLRNLIRLGVIPNLPGALDKKRYLQIEENFRKFSKETGIRMDELDLLFWSMETGEIFK